MNARDLIRHFEKAEHALHWTLKHLTLTNEANAALHLADKVFYSPLTSDVHEALDSVRMDKWNAGERPDLALPPAIGGRGDAP